MTKIIYLGEQPKNVANKQLKPIELKYTLNSSKKISDAGFTASDWYIFKLICKNYTSDGLDIMMAYANEDKLNSNNGCLYLGKWNSGMKEVPKLKPIEFVHIVYSNGHMGEASIEPKEFDIIEVVSISPRDGFDKFYCYSKGERNEGALFLGHLNDGVVE